MTQANWLIRTACGLVCAAPLVAFAAPPHSVPSHAHPLQNSLTAASCVSGPTALACASFSASSGYDLFSGTTSTTYFDANETHYLSGGGFTLRYISCSVLLKTLAVDKRGATLAETLLDPASPNCFTYGYSIINDVYDPDFGGFQSVLHVSGSFSAPQFVNTGTQVSSRVDNSTGAKSNSTCVIGSGENLQQGGFFFNGDFYPASGPDAQSVTSYAKCTYKQ